MSTRELRLYHLQRAIDDMGGVKQFARDYGVTHQAIYLWRKKGVVPLDRAVAIERKQGIAAMNLVDPKLASTVRQLMALNA